MTTLDEVRGWDAADPLGAFRARFRLPEGVIYLDGNSLGALPHATAARMRDAIEREWGDALVRSWNDAGWVEAPARVGAKIARLIGAEADEVIVANSTTVDLFKLAIAAAGLRDGAIVAERDNFPTDSYVGSAAAALIGRAFRAVPAGESARALTADVAVAILTHVDYRTAVRHDMAALNGAARASDTKIVWDLSHSVGAVPLDLHRDGVELAVGCGYKYLNGGPGAPAFLYVARHLQSRIASPIAGWWSHAAPFDFAADYRAAPGIARFAAGTPPMLGLLALESGVDLMLEADPHMLWAKSIRLYDLFAERLAQRCPDLAIVSPADAGRRGSHISIAHPNALAIVRALTARGVIGDFRTPDIARFGLTPLYLSFTDIWNAVETLADVMDRAEWRDPRFSQGGVVT
ncbi:kynureninase [Sphingomonas sp. MMS24-J13]|uniref:kynureninase n=1 Tax=Sphingomonas sp. MMS24-J13 TaxID=3238686 RepID=UPI00384F6CE5